ncbi:ABC transporter, permease protein [Marvinbryantia formatexigens DSM 14469]|uniref:ABC transporter, permease protein n=1 Tax=Marvinbryantia formatexigens DSM 14469 TaxID=478749 RepID=C6LGX1_9FIRM|nr:sugar ABC transporter permease [Marvinbryantia formatexigens]EET60030.1 ABC transporter, permease protein [Marvinbryantia formatexigens DSM 14469]UWO23831.1 sugar ABC transporter permease [Marvinbryantia formatexigens DSM 14469]SDG49528.1 multiple sugar transport system permease protein [Marvinbryantia formatexigens]
MKKHRKLNGGAKMGFLFALPAAIYMMIFIGYPMIQNLILSFKNVDVYSFAQPDNQKFIGFQNYIELFTSGNSIMTKAIINTLIFTVGSIFFQFIIGFGLALLFSRKFPGCSFFRGVTMISWLLPVTVAGLLFKFMFASSGGIVNQFLMALGLIEKPMEWLLQPKTAMVAIIIANIWIGIPFNMMLLITGLTTIPAEVYESCSLDGANKLQTLFRITIPMIKPAIMSVLTLGFVYTFKVFDLVWVMTKGGPVNSTELVSTYAYRLSFEEFQFSKGAAAANILFLILLVVGIFYIKLINEEEEIM